MHVFITGASGFIGSAVVRELVSAGHQVTGLARSDASAAKIVSLQAAPHLGNLDDHDSLAAGARMADAVIHLGFNHDSGDFAAAAESDRRAIAVIGEALAGSNKILIGTSGTMLLAPGKLGTEDDAADPNSAASFRVAAENAVLSFAEREVRASIIRPAPTVHGEGDQGFISMLVGMARAKQESPFIADGTNRWPAVHRLDAARLFRRVLEHGEAGARYHAVGESEIAFSEIAQAIGKGLNLPVVSKTVAQAADHFDGLAFVVSADNPASNALTRHRLGWAPQEASLLADLATPMYFEN